MAAIGYDEAYRAARFTALDQQVLEAKDALHVLEAKRAQYAPPKKSNSKSDD